MDSLANTAGAMSVVAVIFLLLLAVLWIVLPFAIFGTKDVLRELRDEQRRTNNLLDQLGKAVCEYGDQAADRQRDKP